MASQGTDAGGRPSFAKVLARPPVSRTDAPVSQSSLVPGSADIPSTATAALSGEEGQDELQGHLHLNKAVQELSLLERKEGVHGSDAVVSNEPPSKTDATFDDTQTHLSNSSTKPTSFDSKSMASVTTFAMDEKESLRPDDSASVQAAEEDEAFSGSISGAQNSRVGSETGNRLNQISDAAGVPQSIPGVLPGDANYKGEGSHVAALAGESTTSSADERQLHGFPNEPDEKLLEAMDSPKDRLLLLQLEDKIITFIKSTNEQSLELPPCNAFGRLLAHKLGDYYHLTHFVDNNVTSVRLHRTPWCRLPTPLSMLQPATNKTPPPTAPAMKIMRRVGQPNERASTGESTGPSSSVASKAASEIGADASNDGAPSSAAATPAKDRVTLSREEREAKYQEARERIFRDFPESKTSDSPNSGEQSTNISRSNSKTGRKKPPRQKTPLDDGFEARSQFNAYYYGALGHLPYNGMMHDGSFMPPNNFMVGQPAGANFAPGGQANSMYAPHGSVNGMHQYPVNNPSLSNQAAWHNGGLQQASPVAGYIPPAHAASMMPPQQTPTRSAPNMNSYTPPAGQYLQSSPTWGQPQYQPNFQVPPQQRNSGAMQWSNMAPHPGPTGQVSYGYGQPHNQTFPQSPQGNPAQHPMPGSFTRPQFNPQSRSFAPGGNSHPKYTENGTSSQSSGSQFGNPPTWQNAQENLNPSPRQGSVAQSSHGRNNLPPSSNPATPYGKQGEGQDSISKWGTPSHLPPKPPPSEVPYNFNILGRVSGSPSKGHPNDSPTQSMTGPLVVSGATGRQKSQLQGG